MHIKKAEVWHTYTSFYNYGFMDVNSIAHILVSSQVVLASIDSNGNAVWRENNALLTENVVCDMYDAGNTAKVKISRTPQDPQQRENIFWLINFAYNQDRLLRRDNYYKQVYVRMLLSEMAISINRDRFFIQPIITIYQNGVVICNFRLLIGDTKDFNHFINYFVKTFIIDFERLFVSPEIAALHNKKYNTSATNNTEYKINGISGLDLEEVLTGKDKFKLRNIALELFSIIEDFANQLHGKNKKINLGNRWNGHSQIHLLEFVGQRVRADENLNKFKKEIYEIINHLKSDSTKGMDTFPLTDLRLVNDFCAFYSEVNSVYIWSKSGLENSNAVSELGKLNMVQNNQAIANYIEYLVIAHHKILDQAQNTNVIEYTYDMEEYYYYLKNMVVESGTYAEINNFISSATKARKIDELSKQIENIITLNRQRMLIKRDKKQVSYANTLVVIFGLISIPTFANEVIKPILKVLNIDFGLTKNLAKLSTICISALIIMLIIILMKPKDK